MSATFTINSDSFWGTSTGIFHTTIEIIIEAMVKNGSAVPEELPGIVKYQAQYGGLGEFSVEEFRGFAISLLSVYYGILQNWDKHPYDNRDYWYMYELSILKSKVMNDSRFPTKFADQRGTLVIGEGVSWSAPTWVYEFVVENMIAWLQAKDMHQIAASLFDKYRSKELDLAAENATEAVKPVMEYLYQHIVVKYLWYEDSFQKALIQPLTELHDLFN